METAARCGFEGGQMGDCRAGTDSAPAQRPLGRPGADQRTIIAADPQKKLVWIACFDKASYRFISYYMERRGAKIITALDGGSSKAMVIGSGAKNVRSGTITGNWKPVATVFGFKANAE